MELKYATLIVKDSADRSNRTFMELKYGMIIGIYRAVPF